MAAPESAAPLEHELLESALEAVVAGRPSKIQQMYRRGSADQASRADAATAALNVMEHLLSLRPDLATPEAVAALRADLGPSTDNAMALVAQAGSHPRCLQLIAALKETPPAEKP